ncbi:MAG: hypothetical protein GY714_28910, partial [Desulfobacterales bacterium]|nr:hypothetical protein [Desulfobacterales bacterium]
VVDILGENNARVKKLSNAKEKVVNTNKVKIIPRVAVVVARKSTKLELDESKPDDELRKIKKEIEEAKASHGYRRLKTAKTEEDKSPEEIVGKIKELILRVGTKQRIYEPMAGSGALTKVLPRGSLAIEKDEKRVLKGRKDAPQATWFTGDVFSLEMLKRGKEFAPTILLANPEFSLIMPLIVMASWMLGKGG